MRTSIIIHPSRSIGSLLAVLACALFAPSCANPFEKNQATASSGDRGELIVQIPTIATWLQELQSGGSKSASDNDSVKASRTKAMCYANKYMIEVLDASSQAVIDPVITTPSSAYSFSSVSSTSVKVPWAATTRSS
jgi:hypothetical protein